MKASVLLALVATTVSARVSSRSLSAEQQLAQSAKVDISTEKKLQKAFAAFHKEYKKDEDGLNASPARLNTFKEECERINVQNEKFLLGESTWWAGINAYSDLTLEEKEATLTGLELESKFEHRQPNPKLHKHLPGPSPQFVASGSGNVDYRAALSPMQNQGGCGSCWAFSSVAALEYGCGANMASEQQLVDCETVSWGCSGGWPSKALAYARDHGLARRDDGDAGTSGDYPFYTASDEMCRAAGRDNTCRPDAVVSSGGGEQQLYDMLQVGVVSVYIQAHSEFFSYAGGTFSGSCSGSYNHAVAVVAVFGVELGGQWVIRNSWGTGWGDGGYMYINKGSDACGVESGYFDMPTWESSPTVGPSAAPTLQPTMAMPTTPQPVKSPTPAWDLSTMQEMIEKLLKQQVYLEKRVLYLEDWIQNHEHDDFQPEPDACFSHSRTMCRTDPNCRWKKRKCVPI